MERSKFLSTLGIGLAAACTGCLAACGKGGEATPGGGPTPTPQPPKAVNFNLDLNSDIKSVGESKTTDGVIVVRLATGNVAASFTALQVACPHEGAVIDYKPAQGNFECPRHNSTFTTAGVVTRGPAATNLKKYTVAVTSTTLNVSG